MGNNEKTPKTGMVLQVAFYIGTDIFFPLLIFSDCFSLVLHLARVNATTGSMRRYLDPTEVAQAVQLLQDGTSICTIARRFVVSHSAVSKVWRRFQESSYSRRAGHGRRRSLTHQQDGYQGGTGWALPEPYKMTSSRPLVWMSLTKQSETDFMRVAWGPDILYWTLCSLPGTMELDWHLSLNARIGRSATGTLCFSQMRAGSPWAHVKGSGDAVENVMLPLTSFSMTGLVVGQWWSGEAYPWRDAQTSTG